MKTKTNLALLAALILVTFACRKIEKIEKSGNITPRLVVVCTAGYPGGFDGLLFVVSKSLSAIDNAPLKFLKNAKIVVTTASGETETVTYDATYDEYYTKTIKIKAGEKYAITATAPGLAPVYSEMTFPKPVQVNNVSLSVKGIKYFTEPNTNWYSKTMEQATIKFDFNDPAKTDNFYMVKINPVWAKNQNSYSYLNWTTNYPDAENVNSYSGMGSTYYIKDGFNDGKNITLEFNTSSSYNQIGNLSDSVIGFDVKLFHVNSELYKYWYTIGKAEENSDNPFEEPVQIFSNIKGGYGVFGGFIPSYMFLKLQ